MKTLLILGRQPDLGLAELESLYGSTSLEQIADNAAIVDIDPCNFNFDRLGGSTKFCKLLTELNSTKWPDIEKFLIEVSPEKSKTMPAGKMSLGLSVYDFNLSPKNILASGIKLKKAIQTTGRSVRIVPNQTNELNSAQVIHNRLTSDKCWELVVVKSKNKTFIAQTVKVQDIDAYAKRDQARPFRDSRIGMLPPKLAQIIVNLASGPLNEDQLSSVCDDDDGSPIENNNSDLTVLDPFCGSGVILQEASLMGYSILGSDINDRMVDYSTKNLEWLKTRFKVSDKVTTNLTIGDATNTAWPKFNFVASECNLGAPLSNIPPENQFLAVVDKANDIIEKFLVNISGQLEPGTRLCIAVPAWQIKPDHFKFLPLIDQINDLGYNSLDFKNVGSRQLIYYRPGQIVARQLLTLARK